MIIKPKRIAVARGEILRGPVVTSDAIYAGARDDVTVRFERRTLRKVWEVDSGNFRLGTAIGDAFLTVGGNVAGVRSAADGRLLWSTPTRFGGVGVWQGSAVVDSKAGLELRDPASGNVLCMHHVPGSYTSWALKYGDVGVLQSNRMVKAFNLVSGRIEWERQLLDEMQQRLPAPTDAAGIAMAAGSRPGILIAFHSGATFGLSATDGSIVWHADVGAVYAWPTAHEGRVYGQCVERFWALDEQTGAVLYDVTHDQLRQAYREKNGTVYRGRMAVASEMGYLAVFNLADGALVSLYETTLPLWRTAEADGRLLVATGDGTLLVFDESVWGIT